MVPSVAGFLVSQRGTENDSAVWDASARGVPCVGREKINEMYVRLFRSLEDLHFEPIERFAPPDRVFDDMWVRFRLSGDGFENCPFPIGSKVKMRPLHNFHIRDGLIAKEIGYEIWLHDEQAAPRNTFCNQP